MLRAASPLSHTIEMTPHPAPQLCILRHKEINLKPQQKLDRNV